MRDGEAGLRDRLVAVDEEVEVDRARPPSHRIGLSPLAAELALELEQAVEELPRREVGLEQDGAVQEARLLDDAYRIGLAQRRDCDHVGERVDRGPNRRLSVAEIRSDPDVGARHRSTTIAACPPSSRRSGLPTRTSTRSTGKRRFSSSATAAASVSRSWKCVPSETSRTQATSSR